MRHLRTRFADRMPITQRHPPRDQPLSLRSLHTLLQGSVAAVLLCLRTASADAQAETRWTVDPKASLAWWQVSPHLNHLWATTCPGEPSWRPGEGRSSGWNINPYLELPATGYANV